MSDCAERLEAAFSGDEYEENAAAAAGEGEWSWFKWLALSAHGSDSCRHTELSDTLWPRLRSAEDDASRRLELLRAVANYDAVNQSDLPLPLLDSIRAEVSS